MPQRTSRRSRRSSAPPTAPCSAAPATAGPARPPRTSIRRPGPTTYGRDDSWVAIAVATDEQWSSLCRVLGDPAWAADPALATAAGRVREHDGSTRFWASGAGQRSADEIVERLWGAGVPVGQGRPAPPPARAPAAGARVVSSRRWSIPSAGPPATARSRCGSRGVRSTCTSGTRRCSASTTRSCLESSASRRVEIDDARRRRDHRWLARAQT